MGPGAPIERLQAGRGTSSIFEAIDLGSPGKPALLPVFLERAISITPLCGPRSLPTGRPEKAEHQERASERNRPDARHPRRDFSRLLRCGVGPDLIVERPVHMVLPRLMTGAAPIARRRRDVNCC